MDYKHFYAQVDDLDESVSWQHGPATHRCHYNAYRRAHEAQLPDHQDMRTFDQPLLGYYQANDIGSTLLPAAEYNLQPQYYSSPSTLYDSSNASSDRLSPSIGSPASTLLRTPELLSADLHTGYLSVTPYTYEQSGVGLSTIEPCVAMQYIQKCADALPDEHSDDFGSYEAYEPQELIPATDHYDLPYPANHHQQIPIVLTDTTNDTNIKVEAVKPAAPAPNIRHRRCPKPSHRIAKPPPPTRRQSHSKASAPSQDPHRTPSFPCPLSPYGCPSTFSAKNEWKRHAATQHFRLGFWRCDQCTPSSRPNDFNRKDLFVQHVRRMHSSATKKPSYANNNNNGSGSKKKKQQPRSHAEISTVEATLNEAAERCYRRVREAPERCCCVFCPEEFEGEGGLERRMEHVGKHLESHGKMGSELVAIGEWGEDEELEGWMKQHGVVVRTKKGGLVVPQRGD